LGGDPAVSSTSTYAAVQASFDVTHDLSSSDNWIKFSVDPADGVTSSGTSVFRPQVAILEAASAAPSGPDQWKTSGTGSWTTAGNWTNGVPGNGSSTAVLLGGEGSGVVDLGDYAAAVNSLTLTGSGAKSYALEASGSGSLSLCGSGAGVTVTAGTHTIAAPVTLAGTTDVTVSNPGDLLTISGSLAGPTGGLILSGSGTLELSGVNNYAGGTTVSGGLLEIDSGDALSAGGSLTIAGGNLVL
jgi:autotransporter-associated beta strand protein